MKLLLIFIAIFTCIGARADDAMDSVRAAVRVGSARNAPAVTTPAPARGTVRAESPITITGRSARGAPVRVTLPASATVLPRTAASRAAAVLPRSTAAPRVAARSSVAVPQSGTRSVPVQTRNTSIQTARAANRARAATAVTAVGGNYKACREVFQQCMDEFCANKSAQLKRCACSARSKELESFSSQMSRVEDAMLDFNQRLLTVNMEAEDAAALNKATEGELAFAAEDKSASQKLLDQISAKLKTGTDNSQTRNLDAISLSLNIEDAFDNIDSGFGGSVAAKEGAALYNAALPVCKEMAAEVCDVESIDIAESAYLMSIEQDCNTVARAFETKQEQAIEKAREGGALLDMSRLNEHQQRNADDILTCKKKMLDELASPAVCGPDLSGCLDNTGRYIDPSNGAAFITIDLAGLDNLITRPQGSQTWASVPGNDIFVKFLEGKKKYLEPAMKNCRDASEIVWKDFIEDALAQIKLGQGKKLEEIRQSCTTLTAECVTDASDSIAGFDARALSVFGVLANKTANEMCASLKTACSALLTPPDGDMDWVGGMTGIQTDITFDKILSTCFEVGKNCIVQKCSNITGNFGLCENPLTSINRKSIINRTACWAEVEKCVLEAGDDALLGIFENRGKNPKTGNFYDELYGSSQGNVYNLCEDCTDNVSCAACRISERIWGNCEFKPMPYGKDEIVQPNHIKSAVGKSETLLSWFATNTGTADLNNACVDSSCPVGKANIGSLTSPVCGDMNNFDSAMRICPMDDLGLERVEIYDGFTNCCPVAKKDVFGNCCEQNVLTVALDNGYYEAGIQLKSSMKICAPTGVNSATFIAALNTPMNGLGKPYIVCFGTVGGIGADINCNGTVGLIDEATGRYADINESSLHNFYWKNPSEKCALDISTGEWKTSSGESCSTPTTFHRVHW